MHTSGLTGGAYTLWWVIFNEPGKCSDGVCGEDDVLPPPGNTDAGVAVGYAAGNVVSGNGMGTFASSRSVGDTDGMLFGSGLTNPRGAEVHMVVRYHGPVMPGIADEQISTFEIGCDTFNQPFGCYDPQAAVHPAP